MREQISQKDCFWYEKPAEEWIEALPLGNGRQWFTGELWKKKYR